MEIKPDLVLQYTEGNSNKIWGYILNVTSTDSYYTFWGKVGAVIAFKAWPKDYNSQYAIEDMGRKKRRKGYTVTTMNSLPSSAQEKYEQAATMAMIGLLRVQKDD